MPVCELVLAVVVVVVAMTWRQFLCVNWRRRTWQLLGEEHRDMRSASLWRKRVKFNEIHSYSMTCTKDHLRLCEPSYLLYDRGLPQEVYTQCTPWIVIVLELTLRLDLSFEREGSVFWHSKALSHCYGHLMQGEFHLDWRRVKWSDWLTCLPGVTTDTLAGLHPNRDPTHESLHLHLQTSRNQLVLPRVCLINTDGYTKL